MDKEQHLEADEQYVPATPSPGQVLREAREKLGLSQKDIADKLYLKVGIISDIEDNLMDETTSVTFIKGYVRLYAKNVGLNQEEVLVLFDQYHTTPKVPAKLQSFSRRVAKQAHDDRWMMVTYIIALILIGGVVIWWYQQPSNDDEQNPVTQQPAATMPPASSAAPIIVEAKDDFNTSDAEPDVTGYESVSIDEPAPNNDQTAQAQNVVLANETDLKNAADEEPGIAPVNLTFTFEDECWVNVTDASGEAIAYGIKAAGYVMQVTGMPPFEVTLGAPQVVKIDYAGEAVDMSGFDPKRTAKFNLPMQE